CHRHHHHSHQPRQLMKVLLRQKKYTQDKTTTAVNPVHITDSQDHETTKSSETKDMFTDPGETEVSWIAGSLFRVIVIIVEFAVFVAPTVILLQIICERRA
ncbi:hypothetical protein QQF64_026110, partial [Cirrhinus molitorella]